VDPFQSNPFLLKDLEARLKTSNLFDWIETQAEALAKVGTSVRGHMEFNSRIRKQRQIRSICVANLISNACIRPDGRGQYNIFYAQSLDHDEYRRRFAIAHEIGHTYWFAPGGQGKPLSTIQWALGTDPGIEYLCDLFAAAFLLPRRRLSPLLSSFGDATEMLLPVIPNLSETFKVPEKVVARRLFFELAKIGMAIVSLRVKATQDSKNRFRWRTQWCLFPSELYEFPRTDMKVPLKTNNRVIPDDMLPPFNSDAGIRTELDGRWWELLRTVPTKEAKIPFERYGPKPGRLGFAYRQGDVAFVALPL
jgi:Zn-dependent peptidase ImmA (M78 family)